MRWRAVLRTVWVSSRPCSAAFLERPHLPAGRDGRAGRLLPPSPHRRRGRVSGTPDLASLALRLCGGTDGGIVRFRQRRSGRAWNELVPGRTFPGRDAVHSLRPRVAETSRGPDPYRTTHPRNIDLSALRLPVTKILGERDGIATPSEAGANRKLLPASARWVVLTGANHVQFGAYRHQLGDQEASIPPERQRSLTVAAIIKALGG